MTRFSPAVPKIMTNKRGFISIEFYKSGYKSATRALGSVWTLHLIHLQGLHMHNMDARTPCVRTPNMVAKRRLVHVRDSLSKHWARNTLHRVCSHATEIAFTFRVM